MSKLAANTKQIANQGASGEIRAAKMAVDFALRAEREREAPVEAAPLSHNDREIVERFLARVKAVALAADDPATNEPEATQTNASDHPGQTNEENPDAIA